MKKVFLFILTILYMTVSTGVAMEIHYCMGKKAGVEFYESSSDTCGRCGMTEKNNGCCSDDHKFYKLSDSHKNVSQYINEPILTDALPTQFPSFVWQVPVQKSVRIIANHSPPPDTGPSIYIKNCNFRI